MLKKFISAATAAAIAAVASVSVMAASVDVTGESTYIRPGDRLATGTTEYQTVLVTSEDADLSELTSDQIFYIDQASDTISAFVNMGLKGGQNIEPGTYNMYLVDENGEQSKQQIYVTTEAQAGEGKAFTEISEEDGGLSEPYELTAGSGTWFINKGYKIDFTPAQSMSAYELVISCTYTDETSESGTKTISYPVPSANLPKLSGAGSFELGLQINEIPCDESGNIGSVAFSAQFVPLY